MQLKAPEKPVERPWDRIVLTNDAVWSSCWGFTSGTISKPWQWRVSNNSSTFTFRRVLQKPEAKIRNKSMSSWCLRQIVTRPSTCCHRISHHATFSRLKFVNIWHETSSESDLKKGFEYLTIIIYGIPLLLRWVEKVLCETVVSERPTTERFWFWSIPKILVRDQKSGGP